jgi:hypothetical protein
MEKTVNIKIRLSQSYPTDLWEIIEDKIADTLGELNLKGEITNSVTGNSTHFGEQKDDNV